VHASVAQPETRAVGEGGLLLAVTSQATARVQGWPILALMHARDNSDGPLAEPVASRTPCLMGAEGALEVTQALASLQRGTPSVDVAWRNGTAMKFSRPTQEPVQAPVEALLAYSVDMVELPGGEWRFWLARRQACIGPCAPSR